MKKMIRESEESDLEAILSIWLEASIKAHDFMPPEYWSSKINDMREIYIPSSNNYVFERHDKILGFISVHKNILAAIFIATKQQNNGIGSMLLEFIKTKYQEINLKVYKANSSAVRFYNKHGFIIVGEDIDEHTGHPEIKMKWNL